MKRFLFLFLFFTSCTFAFGQNLIPNPSAEDYIECPSSLGGIEIYLENWQSFRGSPDYWNSCSENPLLGWNNSVGYQEPRTGNGYLGLITFHQGLDNARESFGIELENPLLIGETYFLSFFVSVAYRPISFNMTSNNIGFLLMTDNFLNPDEQGALPNFSTFRVNEIISDTTNWVNIQTRFIADSTYQHLCFGNFFEDENTDTLRLEGDLSNALAYYYFDDFCLSLNPNECDIITYTEELDSEQILMWPNPSSNDINFKSPIPINEISICNIQGDVVLNKKTKKNKSVNIQLNNLQSGMYIAFIQTEKGIFKKRFVVQ